MSRRPQLSVRACLLINCFHAPQLYFSLKRRIGATRHRLNFFTITAMKSRIRWILSFSRATICVLCSDVRAFAEHGNRIAEIYLARQFHIFFETTIN